MAMGALPLVNGGASEEFSIEGRNIDLSLSTASPDYFRVLGVQLLDGRFFTEDDRRDSPSVAIINQTGAQQLWPGKNPIGRDSPDRTVQIRQSSSGFRWSAWSEMSDNPGWKVDLNRICMSRSNNHVMFFSPPFYFAPGQRLQA